MEAKRWKPRPQLHVCLGCGRDTEARSQICAWCAHYNPPSEQAIDDARDAEWDNKDGIQLAIERAEDES